MCGNSTRNIKLNQAEFIDMGSLSRDSAFNVVAGEVRKGSNRLVGWLKHQKMAHCEQIKNAQLLILPWFHEEKEIQRLSETGMLERTVI